MNIPVVIPTTANCTDHSERAASLACLITQLHQWSAFYPIVISHHEDSRRDVYRAFQAVAVAIRPARDRWVLYLQDDVVLAPDFGAIVPNAVKAAQFAGPSIGACSLFRLKDDYADGYTVARERQLYMVQALLIRLPDPVEFQAFSEKWYDSHPQHHSAQDLLIGDWLRHNGQKWLQRAPSAVQHRNLPSTLGRRSTKRQSASYERHYGPLPAA